MKIIFYLGSMTKGGAERVISNISDFLTKKGYEIYIITTVAGKSMYTLNERVIHLTLDKENEQINGRIKRNQVRIKRLDEYIKKIEPDVILSLLPEPTFKLMHLRNKIKVPIIISDRNDPKVEYANPIYYYFMNKYYKKADGFIFQTEEAQKYFKKRIQNNSVVIPNPINEKFVNLPAINEKQKEKTVINVGRLTSQKNQKVLIDAFEIVHKQHNDYILKIFGEGELKEELQKQIDEKHMNGYVKLMGETENIVEELQKSMMFVLSSDYEGMPNALMEAMAVGLPVISTDCPCGGPRYLIKNNDNGILVQVNNKDEIVKAICKIIEDENFAKNIGKNAKKIVDDVNPVKIFEMWENYINEIVKKYNSNN